MNHQAEEDRNLYPLIFVIEDGVFGYAIEQHAFFAKVRYSVNGIEYNTWLENDEFIYMAEIGYESDRV